MKDENRVLKMSHWSLSFGDYEEKRTKPARLYFKGWKGETVSPMSTFENERCIDFLKAIEIDRYWLQSDSYDNAAPSPMGSFSAEGICVWFMENIDHERFKGMLDAIPPRENYYYIKNSKKTLTDDIIGRLEGRNWMLCRPEWDDHQHQGEAILSVQELAPADDVWIKMMLE
jgi:hypothetical protein